MFGIQKKRKIKLVCFDIDNTLLNYGNAEAETEVYVANLLSESTGKEVVELLRVFNDTKHKYLHNNLDPNKYSRQLWFEETLIRLEVIKEFDCKKLEDEYWGYLIPRMKLFPNVINVLESLKNFGNYKIACLTDSDGDKNIKIKRLKHFDIEKYFDYIITTDDTGENKPSIKNWEYLIKISGVNGNESVMIGDHPEIDLLNAKKLEFLTIWTKEHIPVDLHFRYVDYEVKDIGEVINILKKY